MSHYRQTFVVDRDTLHKTGLLYNCSQLVIKEFTIMVTIKTTYEHQSWYIRLVGWSGWLFWLVGCYIWLVDLVG